MDNVDERVNKIIATQLRKPSDQIVASSRLADDLGADSLDTVEIVMAMEVEFQVQLVAKEIRVVSVQDVVDYVRRAIDARDAAIPAVPVLKVAGQR